MQTNFLEYTIIFLDKASGHLSFFNFLTDHPLIKPEVIEARYPQYDIIRINPGFNNRRLDNEYYESEIACI